MNLSRTDLTFITNEPRRTLKDRFVVLIKDSKFFDCLVGYFYLSGFYNLYKALENTEKIRILIGMGISQEAYDLLKEQEHLLSHFEIKKHIEAEIENELAECEDKREIEEGIIKFLEWTKNRKIEIKAYPSRKLHAKLYIVTFKESDRDIGRVITGSSNFTQSGLKDNLEFNVELKNPADYEFAKQKFEELWSQAVEINETFVQTVTEKTWLNPNITPYELYLKLLYEYFKDELSRTDEILTKYLPQDFKELTYQKQAVINAKKILEEYGGVFISDVVGLGKTYVTAMLVSQLDGRTMVIAPPALLDENNPGSWPNVFTDFHILAKFISTGKLDEAIYELNKREDYKNIVIDEAHRFRNESTLSYEKLAEICRGKRVILVSATPYNNSPKDILAQLKLFQNVRKSTIPGVSDLERFFSQLEKKLKIAKRSNNPERYIEEAKEVAKEIRNRVLKYVMVRRTRKDIETYFKDDLEKNNIKFPEVEAPKPIFYQLNNKEDEIFMKTVQLLTKNLTYARYTPLLYLKKRISQLEEQSQRNLGSFMKVLLVKRLESSFFAFRNSIQRFINSYQKFLDTYDNGYVFISKQYINKIFELLENGDDEAIQKLIDEGKAEKYESKDFKEEFRNYLENDLKVLKNIKSMWDTIERDPKLEVLIEHLENNKIMKNKKIIIFTESKETANYLVEKINERFGKIALLFYGGAFEEIKNKVIENFDARAKNQKDEFKILVSTDVLSEGVNLHRSNIVINYDIPWNPTKLIQRVGRVNRIDTKFDKIYTFNFFPTAQAESEIDLIKIARSKVEAFLNLLGDDAAILTEGEPVESHELFDKLISKEVLLGDEEFEESELKYFKIIEKIRNENPDLFEKIKRLPKKARSSRKYVKSTEDLVLPNSLITFFRKGKLMKFYISNNTGTYELDFLTTAKIFECSEIERKTDIPIEKYYELLEKNKTAFSIATATEEIITQSRKGLDSSAKLLKILKATLKNGKQLTDEQEDYIKTLIQRLEEGAIPKKTIQKVLKSLNLLEKEISNPLQVIKILQTKISPAFLKSHYVYLPFDPNTKSEVILSLYLTGD
jgi:superfamily II DNA or RNA helicase